MTASTVNPFKRLQSVIGAHSRIIATVYLVNNDGTSIVTLRDGTHVRVRGASVAASQKCFILDGVIQSEAPNLPSYSVTV